MAGWSPLEPSWRLPPRHPKDPLPHPEYSCPAPAKSGGNEVLDRPPRPSRRTNSFEGGSHACLPGRPDPSRSVSSRHLSREATPGFFPPRMVGERSGVPLDHRHPSFTRQGELLPSTPRDPLGADHGVGSDPRPTSLPDSSQEPRALFRMVAPSPPLPKPTRGLTMFHVKHHYPITANPSPCFT